MTKASDAAAVPPQQPSHARMPKASDAAAVPPQQPCARVHVLYLEQADDQRGEDGKRCAGVHLNAPGRGPCLCPTCGGVADVWRGRLDNMQTTLRMCCAEGALFRPFVAQFAFASPRASLLYDIPRLGDHMREIGSKRPTEALIVGSALRAHAGELSAAQSGVECARHALDEPGEPEEMWTWVGAFLERVRARASADGGVSLALTLDRKAPLLSPSPLAGVLATAAGGGPRLTDVVVVLGGPSGLGRGWGSRLDALLGEPRMAVSLRGGLQHSYCALLEVLLMHERGELAPLLADRLALPAETLRRARVAEHELRRAWLACLGLDGSAPLAGGAAQVALALERHAPCLAALTSLSGRAACAAPAPSPPEPPEPSGARVAADLRKREKRAKARKAAAAKSGAGNPGGAPAPAAVQPAEGPSAKRSRH